MHTFTEAPLVKTGIHITAGRVINRILAPGGCPWISSQLFEAFEKQFPNGADYQEVLHWTAGLKESSWWGILFMTAVGPAPTVTKVYGNLKIEHGFFAGSLRVAGTVQADRLEVGGSVSGRSFTAHKLISEGFVQSKWRVKCAEGIWAKAGVKADGEISAGHIQTFGNISSRESIYAHEIDACGLVTAKQGIYVTERLKADEGIKAGWGVGAGKTITAAWIDCKTNIFAGLVSRPNPIDEEIQIKAVIRRGTVVHGTLVEP